jgi:hypothetical protein
MIDSIYAPGGTTTSSSVCLQHTVTRSSLKVNDLGSISPERDYFTTISAGTGITLLVPPETGFNILVKNYTVTSNSGTVVRFLSGTGYITGNIYMGDNDQLNSATLALKTNMSEGLSVYNTTGSIGGSLTYRIV